MWGEARLRDITPKSYLVVKLPDPAQSRSTYILMFWVDAVINTYWETLPYGPLPLTAGQVLARIPPLAGTVTVPADGVMPAYSMVEGLLFKPVQGLQAYDDFDMWYVPEDRPDILMVYSMQLRPGWLRIEVALPQGMTQARFLEKTILGVDKVAGYVRGRLTIPQIAGLHFPLNIANDTNLDVYTNVVFKYKELRVKVVDDAEKLKQYVEGRLPAVSITLPLVFVSDMVIRRIQTVYNVEMKTIEEIKQGVAG